MFFIPGFIISIFTFPGVIIHEIAHRFFAEIAGVPVYEVCYFRLGNPAGYVVHGNSDKLKQIFLISIGPLIINSILCAIVGFSVVYPVFILEVQDMNPVFGILIWLSLSIGMHAFPSNQDMQEFVNAVRNTQKKNLLYFAAKALAILFKIVNAFRIIWIDLFYAVGINILVPYLLGVV